MTERTKQLIEELEQELATLPEAEQERRVASYLRDLRRGKQQAERGTTDQEDEMLYEPFRIMLDSDLDLPSDYSETYEDHLYGDKKQRD